MSRALVPGLGGDQLWLGQQCLTGDGRFAAVVVAPQVEVSTPAAIIAGALAYSVDVSTGRVRPLLRGVSFAYFDPGCGAGPTAAFVRYLDAAESRTRVTTVNLATGASIVDASVTGEVASAVPVGVGAVAARGSDVLRIGASGNVMTVARTSGVPYALRPAPGGGVDFLVAPAAASTDSTTHLWELRGAMARPVASGPLGTLLLFLGRGGRNIVVGARADSRAALTQRAPAVPGRPVESASLDGQVLLTGPVGRPAGGREKAPTARPTGTLIDSETGVEVPYSLTRRRAAVARAIPPPMKSARTAGAAAALAPADSATPACAVPRNDPSTQVLQPNAAEVDWAIQEGVRNLLTGANGRPAGYLNLGLPAYSPDADFPTPALQGGGSIPPQVVEGIFAAESNWDQASPHAPPGTAGNPLIANYYGTDASLSTIDYSQADCGYGIGQVTDFMTAADTSQPQSIKDKVALDYAENAAAAITILAGKWNQLLSSGIVIGSGDPSQLEDWYFAIWAYNTGVHPDLGDGSPWGLGWVNNPINPTFPPNRQPFLRTTLDDAKTPNQWPYQEQVFGWMETALWDGNGNAMYEDAFTRYGSYLALPAHSAFCSTSQNACDPTQSQPCTRSDLECWWHAPIASWCGSSGCHTEYFNISTSQGEPADPDPHPPVCTLDGSFPSGTAVVANEASDVNLVGCPDPPSNWTSSGGYAVTYGTNSSGQPTGVVDYHQLGGAFGGYFFFTHTEPSSDVANTVTASWTPPSSVAGLYDIRVFVPDFGATTTDAAYEIQPGAGAAASFRLVDQNAYSNQWVSLGEYFLHSGAQLLLSNVTSDGSGVDDIAFSSVAFVAAGAGTYDAPTVSSGGGHALVALSDGTVWSAGLNDRGQLGDGTNNDRVSGLVVPSLSNVIAVASGNDDHSLALTADGQVWAWGANESGQLGDGTTTDRSSPVAVRGAATATAITAGTGFSAALMSDGTVWTWGSGAAGELGSGTTTGSLVAQPVSGLNGIVQLAAGAGHLVALRSDGTVWDWGANDDGQLGNGTTTSQTSAVQVSGVSGIVQVAAGAFHTLALASGGATVWGWGANEYGELGGNALGGSTDVPVQVATQQQIPAGVAALSAGLFSSSAVANDGTVWSWGRGIEGQIGNGGTANRASPVEALNSGGLPFIGSGAAITTISSGLGRVMAVGDDGTVWIWGQLIGGVQDAVQFDLFPSGQPTPAPAKQKQAPPRQQGPPPVAPPVTPLPMCPTYIPVAVDIVNDLVASRGTPGPYGQADSLSTLAPPIVTGPTTTVLLRWGTFTWGKLHIDTAVEHGWGASTPADNSNPRFRSAQALALGSASGAPVQDAPNSTTYRYYYHYTFGVAQVPCTRKVVVQFQAGQGEPGPKYIVTTFDYPGSNEQ